MGHVRDALNRLTETVYSRDMDALRKLYAEDAVLETPGDEGPLRGPDAIVAALSEILATFPDASYDAVYEYESGDTAIDEGFFVGTFTGPLHQGDGMVFAPTGRSVRLRGCQVVSFRDGLVTHERHYFDFADFFGQLGLLDD